MKQSSQKTRKMKGAQRHGSTRARRGFNLHGGIRLARKAVMIGAGLALTAMIVWGGRFLVRPDSFPVDEIAIRGEIQHVDVAAYEKTLMRHLTGGFFSLQIGPLKELIESEAWVYKADLRRRWVSGRIVLVVDIEEQKPIVRWGETQLLNRFAEPFTVPVGEMPQGLPLITGGEGREVTLVEDYIRYDEMLASIGLTLSSLSEDSRHNQTLILDSSTTIILGRDHHDDRVGLLTAVYPRILKSVMAAVAVLDLRYSSGFSVNWRDQAEQLARLDLVGRNSNQK